MAVSRHPSKHPADPYASSRQIQQQRDIAPSTEAASSRCCHSLKEIHMSNWSKDELRKIAETDDLHIAPFREDGKTYGTSTWIWSVVVDDELYVRAYNGQDSSWYQAALRQKAGRIKAAGMTKEVGFEPVGGKVQDR